MESEGKPPEVNQSGAGSRPMQGLVVRRAELWVCPCGLGVPLMYRYCECLRNKPEELQTQLDLRSIPERYSLWERTWT